MKIPTHYMRPTVASRLIAFMGLACIIGYFYIVAIYGYEVKIVGYFSILAVIGVICLPVSKNFNIRTPWIEPTEVTQKSYLKKCRIISAVGTIFIVILLIPTLMAGIMHDKYMRIDVYEGLFFILLISMLLIGVPNYLYYRKYS